MSKLRTIFKNKYAIRSLVVLALVVGISGSMMAIGGGDDDGVDPRIPLEVPSFSMTFNKPEGQSVSVGNRQVASEQIRRLDYNAPDRWVETVIASPDIVTQWGTFSKVGSYQRVDGDTYTTYDATTGDIRMETIERGRRIPGIYMSPMPIHGINKSDSPLPSYNRVTTSARVCFNDSCTDNAQGISFTDDNREYIYADDARGIPLKFGTGIEVTELTVHSEHQAIP